MRALTISLAAVTLFAAAMLFGWTQARVAPSQAEAAKASGGADLYANNPFVKGAK